MTADPASSTRPYDPVKRVVDMLGAAIGLVITAPLQAGIAVLVGYRLGRPILFHQQRPGRHGKPFTLIKFRTMRNPDGGAPLSDADRLSAFGAALRSASLDELPTLWNVLRGDMSLVGPRPLLMQYLARYTPEEARRHEVRPGMTGSAQVAGRNALTWEQKFAFDVVYVDSRGLALDLRILALTILAVVRRSGISAAGEATMREFTGSRQVPQASMTGADGASRVSVHRRAIWPPDVGDID